MNKKILVLIVCLLLMPIFLFAQDTFKAGSEPTGFRGMEWGTPISSFSEMKLTESVPGAVTLKKIDPKANFSTPSQSITEKSYRNENDVLQIDGVSLDEINYIFYSDKFSGVMLYSHGREVFEQLKTICFAKYGDAKLNYASGSYFADYSWQGSKTKVALIFGAGDVVILVITSIK